MRHPETFMVSPERKDEAEISRKVAKTRIECLAVISWTHPDPWAATRRPRPIARSPFRFYGGGRVIPNICLAASPA
jgi:hypothetical protein